MSIVNTLSAIFIVLIILLIVYTYSGSNKISSEEAKKMIKKGNIKYVIDVRSNMEWEAGHYKGALHIPVQEITEEKLNELNITKNKGILVYCNTGQRARYAADKIKGYGYKKVYYIAGTYKSLE